MMGNGPTYEGIVQQALDDDEFFWRLLNDPEGTLLELGVERDSPVWTDVMDALSKTLGGNQKVAKSHLHNLMRGTWRR